MVPDGPQLSSAAALPHYRAHDRVQGASAGQRRGPFTWPVCWHAPAPVNAPQPTAGRPRATLATIPGPGMGRRIRTAGPAATYAQFIYIKIMGHNGCL